MDTRAVRDLTTCTFTLEGREWVEAWKKSKKEWRKFIEHVTKTIRNFRNENPRKFWLAVIALVVALLNIICAIAAVLRVNAKLLLRQTHGDTSNKIKIILKF